MTFIRHIPLRYFSLIPAIYFAFIGAMDIGADMLEHKLTAFNFFFNLALFAPLLLPFRPVWIVCGFIACLFALYGSIALLMFLDQHLGGQHMRSVFATFVVGPIFVIITLLAGLSLIYAGNKMPVRADMKKEL